MIRFEYQFDQHTPKIIVETTAEATLTDLLGAFESFLIAAGYNFEGNVDIVPPFKTEEVN